jgi:hypothetical protein
MSRLLDRKALFLMIGGGLIAKGLLEFLAFSVDLASFHSINSSFNSLPLVVSHW